MPGGGLCCWSGTLPRACAGPSAHCLPAHTAPSVPQESTGRMRTPLFCFSPACVLNTTGRNQLSLQVRTARGAVLVSFCSGCVFLGCFWICLHASAPGTSLVLSLSVSVVLCHFADYSKGFGGKYGVQKDRMDKVRIPDPGLSVFCCRVREFRRSGNSWSSWCVSARLRGWSGVGCGSGFQKHERLSRARVITDGADC